MVKAAFVYLRVNWEGEMKTNDICDLWSTMAHLDSIDESCLSK